MRLRNFCLMALWMLAAVTVSGFDGTGDSEDTSLAVGDAWPRWTATADAMFLQRRRPAGTELIVNVDAPAERLDASDIDLGVGAGLDATVACQLTERLECEVRYFGVDGWNGTTAVATTPGDPLRINTAYPLLTVSGDAIDASYRSELHNVELNGRLALGKWLTALGGFRYLELDDQFSATVQGAQVPFDLDVSARNRLYGAQLGGQVLLWNDGGRISIEGVGKAGIYGNAAAQQSQFSTGVVTLGAHDAKSTTAFLGELGLWGDCCLTDRLSLRGGYRLLWLEGVALASDQVAASDFIFDRGLDAGGGEFYHGAFVGLQYVH